MSVNNCLNILGNVEVCSLLMKNGADIHAKSTEKNTALVYALQSGK